VGGEKQSCRATAATATCIATWVGLSNYRKAIVAVVVVAAIAAIYMYVLPHGVGLNNHAGQPMCIFMWDRVKQSCMALSSMGISMPGACGDLRYGNTDHNITLVISLLFYKLYIVPNLSPNLINKYILFAAPCHWWIK